jgi:hypothetical protein
LEGQVMDSIEELTRKYSTPPQTPEGSTTELDVDALVKRYGTAPPGHIENPLNEQGVSDGERFLVKTVAPNPDSAVEWLQRKGYEAAINSAGDIVVRKGEESWKQVEPKGKWYKPWTWELQDVSDATDEVGSAIAMAGGAAVGAPGLLTGAAGAGLGAAGAEGVRQAAGQLAGFKTTPGQVAKDIVTEGAIGGAADLATAGAAKLFKSQIKPLLTKGRRALYKTEKELIEELSGAGDDALIAAGKKAGITTPMSREEVTRFAASEGPERFKEITSSLRPSDAAKKNVTETAKEMAESQPGFELASSRNMERIKDVINNAKDEPFEITWRTANGKLRTIKQAMAKPSMSKSMEAIERQAAELSDNDLKQVVYDMWKANKWSGNPESIFIVPAAGSKAMSRKELLQKVYENQPGFVKRDKLFDFVEGKELESGIRFDDHGYMKFWDAASKNFETGWRRVKADTVTKIKLADGTVHDFTRFMPDTKDVAGKMFEGQKVVKGARKLGLDRMFGDGATVGIGRALQAPMQGMRRLKDKMLVSPENRRLTAMTREELLDMVDSANNFFDIITQTLSDAEKKALRTSLDYARNTLRRPMPSRDAIAAVRDDLIKVFKSTGASLPLPRSLQDTIESGAMDKLGSVDQAELIGKLLPAKEEGLFEKFAAYGAVPYLGLQLGAAKPLAALVGTYGVGRFIEYIGTRPGYSAASKYLHDILRNHGEDAAKMALYTLMSDDENLQRAVNAFAGAQK